MAEGVAGEIGTFRREKVIILAVWFAGLIGVRLLMASLLAVESIWIATVGSIGIIFAIFYVVLKHTPLSRHSKSVNSALFSWFSKKYFFWGVLSSMVVLSSLIFLSEVGYIYYSDELVTFEQLRNADEDANSFNAMQELLSSPPDNTLAEIRDRHGIIGSLPILIASVDKTLGGYYVKAVSFILAEDVEVLIFMILVRRSGEKGLFRSDNVDRKLSERNEKV